MNRLFTALIVAGALHGQAATAATDFSPAAFKLKNGQPDQLLVLGTTHLSNLPKTFNPANLNGLMDRLVAWHPNAITVETLSGPQCAYLRSYPARYADTVKTYCEDTTLGHEATGLEVPAATEQAESMLAAWPQAPSASQRRRLASLFLAGGEPASATVQWLRLPAAERHAGDGLNQKLVEMLEALRQKRSEEYLIAAPLAARLGHERLYSMDDHTADAPSTDEKAYGEAVMKAWDNPHSAARRKTSAALEAHLDTPDGVLAMYRAYNAAGQSELTFRSDFGAALEEPSPQRFGREYVAGWETRNLRMAANIREVMAARPGSRMLVIVGASHKGYLDAYLDQMHDVRVDDAEAVLRTK
ncbi:hypothetical protein GTP38_12590 [Duganella sp. FT94W]|uniref:TraB/GumN family protein n=1 Tax=Duganella lactea TaxID=2692173 RepID=A0ABW9V939_9BURK|nr:DUF5694 domain-containing protein [Duganella lactea]MYM35168.1 hypothetical protein [Duganella lactea]